MRKSIINSALTLILSLTFFTEIKSNDFPTLARSEFVFACMSSNANNRDFMSKCSCAIDEIAKSYTRMGYFFPIKNDYLNLVGEDPDDFKNVVFNRFNKNDFMKYF